MTTAQTLIEIAYERRQEITPLNVDPKLKKAIADTIALLGNGQLRVAEKIQNQWQVHAWLKKAVLLYFRIKNNCVVEGQFTRFFDKVPLKYAQTDEAAFQQAGARVVPPATIRAGAYIAANTVIMPAFVNIGAYVDSGTMVDTWSTIGSCAQIGKNVHISGGVGIGGVLEPLQVNPVIIEDNCFIGARSEIAEGVIVEQGAVISMGVFLSQSTRIYDRATGQITYGRVPAGAVVVAGSLPAADGSHSLNCAVIVKQVDEKTRSKTSINELLRNIE
jgi:2,3,4,5-tetrahydropyridine-2-carboxylate N-succinyltransferase